MSTQTPTPRAAANAALPALNLRWYEGLTWYHWWVFTVGALAWLFDCADQQIFNLARTPALRDVMAEAMRHLTPLEANAKVLDYATYSTASTMVGWAVGGLFFGIVGDRWGRVKTLSVAILVYSLFTGLCGMATSGWTFCLYRFLMGGGIGGAFAAAATLIAETLPEHARATCLGLFSALSVLGNMLGVALARFAFLPEQMYFAGTLGEHGVAGWRLLFCVGAMPAFLVVFVIMTLKESEQWKAARRLASENVERQLGDLKSMFRHPTWRRNTLVAVGLATAGIVGVWGVGFFSPELIDEALTPAAYAGKTLPPDVAKHISEVRGNALLLQHLGGFIGILAFTYLATRVGRRLSFTVAFLGGFVSVVVVFLTLNSAQQAYFMLPFMGLFTVGVMGGFVIYFPEIFPTRFRSTGTAFGYNVARLSAAAVMLLGNNIRSALGSLGFAHPFRVGMILLSGIYLLGLIILLWAPETRGRPLPEED